jgi:hypothetical protein
MNLLFYLNIYYILHIFYFIFNINTVLPDFNYYILNLNKYFFN